MIRSCTIATPPAGRAEREGRGQVQSSAAAPPRAVGQPNVGIREIDRRGSEVSSGSLAQRVHSLRRQGLGWRAIAHELGSTRDRVRGALRSKPHKARPTSCTFVVSPDGTRCGAPIEQARTGRRLYCLEHGPRKGAPARELWARRSPAKVAAEVLRRRDAGEGYRAIAQALGIPRDRARRICQKAGRGGWRARREPVARSTPPRRLADVNRCACGAAIRQLRRGAPRIHCYDCRRRLERERTARRLARATKAEVKGL